jgi:hypothetical protein
MPPAGTHPSEGRRKRSNDWQREQLARGAFQETPPPFLTPELKPAAGNFF